MITRKIEDSDLDTYEDYYEDWCQDQKRRLKNGELVLVIFALFTTLSEKKRDFYEKDDFCFCGLDRLDRLLINGL